ncbi:NUDIX hydrolase [Leptospira interrogans]
MSTENEASKTHWPKAAASAAIFRGDTVLIVERGKPPIRGVWSLPGGHIEPGETAKAAAAREVMEETGVTCEVQGLTDVHDVIFKDGAGALRLHYVLAVFYGRWIDGEPAAASDTRDARFVQLDDLSNFRLTDGAERIIRAAHQLQSSRHA